MAESSGAISQSELVAALIEAKCSRWVVGTCVSRAALRNDWCSVCRVLVLLGYEPVTISDGSQTWRPAETGEVLVALRDGGFNLTLSDPGGLLSEPICEACEKPIRASCRKTMSGLHVYPKGHPLRRHG